jgi:hypothetical protein
MGFSPKHLIDMPMLKATEIIIKSQSNDNFSVPDAEQLTFNYRWLQPTDSNFKSRNGL